MQKYVGSLQQKISYIVIHQMTSHSNLERGYQLLKREEGGTNFFRHHDTLNQNSTKKCVNVKIIGFLSRNNVDVKRGSLHCIHCSCDVSHSATEDFQIGIVAIHKYTSTRFFLGLLAHRLAVV